MADASKENNATATAEAPKETLVPKDMEITTKIKFVDANGLALICLGFGTWMFFAFNCNINNVGQLNKGVLGSDDNKFGVFYLPDMMTWGCGLCLVVAGLVQGINGDHLGFTSYIFHGAIIGTLGYNFKCALGGCGIPPPGPPMNMMSFFCYAAVWFEWIFAIMAFRIAKMFGILYLTISVMFFVMGLNWMNLLHDETTAAPGKDFDRTGDYIVGVSCLIVCLQCFYLLVPVMTGIGIIR